jgi:hypothetical protein
LRAEAGVRVRRYGRLILRPRDRFFRPVVTPEQFSRSSGEARRPVEAEPLGLIGRLAQRVLRLCATQAFALGRNVSGLQFHPEFDPAGGIERWLIGHAAELAAAGVDPRSIRSQATEFREVLRDAARRMLSEWLDALE